MFTSSKMDGTYITHREGEFFIKYSSCHVYEASIASCWKATYNRPFLPHSLHFSFITLLPTFFQAPCPSLFGFLSFGLFVLLQSPCLVLIFPTTTETRRSTPEVYPYPKRLALVQLLSDAFTIMALWYVMFSRSSSSARCSLSHMNSIGVNLPKLTMPELRNRSQQIREPQEVI